MERNDRKARERSRLRVPFPLHRSPWPLMGRPTPDPQISLNRLAIVTSRRATSELWRYLMSMGHSIRVPVGPPFRRKWWLNDAVSVEFFQKTWFHDAVRVRIELDPSCPSACTTFRTMVRPGLLEEDHHVTSVDIVIDYALAMDAYQMAGVGRRLLVSYERAPLEGDVLLTQVAHLEEARTQVVKVVLGSRRRRRVQRDMRCETGLLDLPWTRVEGRVRACAPLSELVALRNPFDDVNWLPLGDPGDTPVLRAALACMQSEGVAVLRELVAPNAYRALIDELARRPVPLHARHPREVFAASWANVVGVAMDSLGLRRVEPSATVRGIFSVPMAKRASRP